MSGFFHPQEIQEPTELISIFVANGKFETIWGGGVNKQRLSMPSCRHWRQVRLDKK